MAGVSIGSNKEKNKPPRRMHINSLKNLKPTWKKGEQPKGAGRPPKEYYITDALRYFAQVPLDTIINENKLTFAQAAALAQWRKARAGNISAMAFITERMEGKLPETLDVSSENRVNHTVEVIKKDDIQPALAALIDCGAIKVNPN
ncbi:MAG: hypothetical protein PVI90_16665 [Desulfobacteraceae bacterium]|jgi:hypothetical protein